MSLELSAEQLLQNWNKLIAYIPQYYEVERKEKLTEMYNHFQDRIILIFGDEGKGMRNLTKKLCDITYRINTIGEIKSLNVSVAIGIVLDKVSLNSRQDGV